MDIIRAFIAVELPEEIKKGIDKETSSLRRTDADIKWVRPALLHITLKFLGDTPQDKIPLISDALKTIDVKAFDADVFGAGAFPNSKTPRIYWIGITGGDLFEPMRRDIEKSMSILGFEAEDKQFRPHITIGRARSQRGAQEAVKRLFDLKDKLFGKIDVNRVSLMKSELKKTGPEYTNILSVPLHK